MAREKAIRKAAKRGRAKNPLNIVERIQRAQRHAALDVDKGVQKNYKRYKKLTGAGSVRMTREQWYDFNYPKYTPKRFTGLAGYARRSRRVAEVTGK